MPDVDVDRLIPIVTGVQLNAELGDRPLAYRIESAARELLARLIERPSPDEPPRLSAVVVSDVFYLNHDALQTRPTISIGGPGVNALSAALVNELPTVVTIENVLVVQMDLEWNDARCAVWGMNHLDTVRAVDTFIAKGYLDMFAQGVVEQLDADADTDADE